MKLAETEREERQHLEETVAPGHRSISFIGSSKGAGTSTQALQFALFLQSTGFRICYIEASGQRQIEKLPALYSVQHMDKEQGYIQYRGLDIYFNPLLVTANMRLAYDVCVFDYGVLSSEKLSSYLHATAKVCILSSTAWEYGSLRWTCSLLEKEKITYLLPFVEKRQQPLWIEKTQRFCKKLFFPTLYADMFSFSKKNKPVYMSLLNELSLTILKKQKRRQTK